MSCITKSIELFWAVIDSLLFPYWLNQIYISIKMVREMETRLIQYCSSLECDFASIMRNKSICGSAWLTHHIIVLDGVIYFNNDNSSRGQFIAEQLFAGQFFPVQILPKIFPWTLDKFLPSYLIVPPQILNSLISALCFIAYISVYIYLVSS